MGGSRAETVGEAGYRIMSLIGPYFSGVPHTAYTGSLGMPR